MKLFAQYLELSAFLYLVLQEVDLVFQLFALLGLGSCDVTGLLLFLAGGIEVVLELFASCF